MVRGMRCGTFRRFVKTYPCKRKGALLFFVLGTACAVFGAPARAQGGNWESDSEGYLNHRTPQPAPTTAPKVKPVPRATLLVTPAPVPRAALVSTPPEIPRAILVATPSSVLRATLVASPPPIPRATLVATPTPVPPTAFISEPTPSLVSLK
jgi:hypothetical protein